MDDTEIAGKLGQLLAGQENTNRDIGRFRDEAARAASAASESRRALYKQMEELKDKLVSDVNEVKSTQKLLDLRVEDVSRQLSLAQPNIYDIPRLRDAVDQLGDAHEDIKKTVTTLKEAKANLEGAARGAVAVTKVWWVVLVAVSSAVGAGITTFWHWIQTGGGPPGR